MSAAARSLQVWSIYLVALAVVLLIAPNPLLGAFRMAPTSEVWIRVVGMMVAFVGVYYWVAAATELVPIFRASVLCRVAVPVFFLVFVSAGWAPWSLLLFGAADLLGAAWTWWALRRSPATA
jgi:hypothetical protein